MYPILAIVFSSFLKTVSLGFAVNYEIYHITKLTLMIQFFYIFTCIIGVHSIDTVKSQCLLQKILHPHRCFLTY